MGMDGLIPVSIDDHVVEPQNMTTVGEFAQVVRG
jgi:hypothetical protein